MDDHACVWKITGNKMKKVLTFEKVPDAFVLLVDGAAVFSYRIDGTPYMTIIDFENKTLYDGPRFEKSPEGVKDDLTGEISFAIVGGDKEKIIVDLYVDRSRNYYTILLDIRNGLEPTLLWSGR